MFDKVMQEDEMLDKKGAHLDELLELLSGGLGDELKSRYKPEQGMAPDPMGAEDQMLGEVPPGEGAPSELDPEVLEKLLAALEG